MTSASLSSFGPYFRPQVLLLISVLAENFYQNGAEVTMVQRSGTYVLTLDKGVFMLHEGCHDENT